MNLCARAKKYYREYSKRIKKLFLSVWFYYVLYTFLLVIFNYVILPTLIKYQIISPDIANNLFSEIIGILLTLILLTMVFELKDIFLWKSVKSKVYDRIRIQLSGIFTEFVNLCECTMGGGVGLDETREDFLKRLTLTQLEELNKNVELRAYAKKFIKSVAYASLFETREKYLSSIESKYFKFLDPDIIHSLMEIQENLHQISLSIKIIEAGSPYYSDEDFFQEVTLRIHNIIKEIYKLNMETEITIT